jgi:hypothetical protein
MKRRIAAVVAGSFACGAIIFACVLAARAAWPAYALAEPTRDYSLVMLIVRLAVGVLATFAAGASATRVEQGAGQAALDFGIIFLLISVVWHVQIWDQYPAWYHLFWLACIVPFSMLGGRLAKPSVAQ